ncbi:unnamed protein product [Acanthoscelides obtectus]|uniref:Uncharacterized protein n=1 Tax=Acanthoscelides obtectus TaxID=200917 RepID=A0A9P0M1R1_ACAOB|nr:unnamed protein product [Acanthoscelides obtectus]CAK1677271.1 hypothetical protein AOBTE_LOCUS31218 [Acanthoscelides obtectus]
MLVTRALWSQDHYPKKKITLCKGIPITTLDYAESFLLNSQKYSEEQRKEVTQIVKSKIRKKSRWIAAHYIDLFLKRNNRWLQMSFEIPQTKSRPGRPQKSFSNISERSKRRKTEAFRGEISSEELTFDTHTKLRSEGKTDASKVIKDLMQSLTRAKNIEMTESINRINPNESIVYVCRSWPDYKTV